jgi:outer membrane receptor protein involved in Fe transport
MRKNLLQLFALLALFTLLTNVAFSQGIVTGSISGTVQDQEGAAIPRAAVTAVQSGTNATFKAESDAQGYFSIKALPVGSYKLSVEVANFAKLQVSGVSVTSGGNTALGAQVLKIGASSEVVNVEATAPLIEATSSQIGATFESKKIQELPNVGLGFDNLALFIPGMAQNSSANFSNTNGASLSSNGLRGRSNNFQIDGQSNNDNSVAGPSIFLSNPDILGELQVVTNNFGAEYGRNTGSVVNYVTKSGTNSFHGSAYDYYTGNYSFSRTNGEKNPLLGFCTPAQATDPVTNKCTPSTIGRSVENRFGGTVGGPIWRNKAWFFGSYQGDRARSGGTPSVSTSFTPTAAGITALAAAFPNNAAVKSLQTIGPFAVAAGNPIIAGTTQIMKICLTAPCTAATPTVPIEFAKISRSPSSLSNDKQITGRGDIQLTEKDRFFARYIFQQSISTVASGTISSGAWVDIPAKDQQIGLDYTRTWSPRFVQQYRFSFSRAGFGFEAGSFPNCLRSSISLCPTSVAIGTTVADLTAAKPANVSMRSFGIANNLPQGRLINNTQFSGNNTYTVGKHTIKFGAEYDRQRSPNVFLPNINGSFSFTNFNTFIQGNASSVSLTDGPTSFNFKEKDISMYGQDDWRVRDNLTINLGLRWEWNQQAVNLLRDITLANQATTPPFWSTAAPANVTQLPAIPEDLNNFGPNIGFAWTPRIWENMLGRDKTVIRGGYRIAYDPSYYNMFLNMATAAPVVNSGSFAGVGLPATGATGADVQAAYLGLIPRGVNPGTRNQTRVSNDFHNPYTQQWSLGIEHQIGSKIGVETRYVGNHTVGNFSTINGNPVITGIPAALRPAGVTPCTTVGAPGLGRPDCNFGNVRLRNNGAWSRYDGLQNRIDVKDLHGMTAGVQYTYSKGIDNVSEIFSATGGGISTPIPQNPFDPNVGERGVSAQSFPHVFTTYWIYDAPWYKSQQGLLGHVLGGWQWGGTFQYQSGAPITPWQEVTAANNSACDVGFNNAFIGVDSCRPIAGNPSAPFDSVGQYIASAATATAACPIGAFCNVSTGAVTTPSAVRFIVNNAMADANLCGGNPYACTISRNTYRAQNRNNLNMSLQKSSNVTERVKLQLRADMFNVFNRQFLGSPGLDVNTANEANGGTFGTANLNTGSRRFIQLLLRVSF